MGSREWGKPALEGCCPELSERPACFSCENRSVPDFAIAPIKGDQASRGKENRCVRRRGPAIEPKPENLRRELFPITQYPSKITSCLPWPGTFLTRRHKAP